MSGFTKLFSSIVHSTIWREKDHIRLVWITMLAIADKNGIVEASLPGLADLARVDLDQCIEAIATLSLPDEFSRNTQYDGRRIEDVDGGWCLLNYEYYRNKMRSEEDRHNNARRQAEWRARQKEKIQLKDNGVGVTNRDCRSEISHNAQSDTDTDTDKNKSNVRNQWPRTFLDSHHKNDAFALTDHLVSCITKVKPDYVVLENPNTYKKWAIELEKMLRLDKRCSGKAKKVVSWALDDSFWQSNILSAGKLRSQFDRLEIQMDRADKGVEQPAAPEVRPQAYQTYNADWHDKKGADPESIGAVLDAAKLPWRKTDDR